MFGVLPAEIGQLASLETFHVNTNTFGGAIPDIFGGMTKLKSFEASLNFFEVLPASLMQAASLETLDLSSNVLEGPIPAADQLSAIQRIDLNTNLLTGEFPASITSLGTLQYLNLATNRLSGLVPTSLGEMTNLEELTLSDNFLGGMLPSEMGLMASLRELRFERNFLTGSIPSDFATMASLEYMSLSGNAIGPDLPIELATMPSLRELDLSLCSFSSLPSEYVNDFPSLEVLTLNNNLITGVGLPLEWTSTALTSLDLSGNQLVIPFPAVDLANLVNLKHLDMATTDMIGNLPSEVSLLLSLGKNADNGTRAVFQCWLARVLTLHCCIFVLFGRHCRDLELGYELPGGPLANRTWFDSIYGRNSIRNKLSDWSHSF